MAPARRRPSDTAKYAALTPEPIGRRRFLVVTGGLVAAAALGPRLAWARKAAQLGGSPGVLQPWTLPNDPPEDNLEVARALIGAAVLAPSEWNTQPWRFEVEHASVRMV